MVRVLSSVVVTDGSRAQRLLPSANIARDIRLAGWFRSTLVNITYWYVPFIGALLLVLELVGLFDI